MKMSLMWQEVMPTIQKTSNTIQSKSIEQKHATFVPGQQLRDGLNPRS